MTPATAILLPMAALVALTAAVWVRLYVERLGEIARRGIDPQAIATSHARAETLRQTDAADNFRNLLELPVLFYALCLALIAADAVSPLFVLGAWVYVALRAVHSAIHCTYNRVVHRFLAYVASSIVLFGLWGAFGVVLLGR
ncbi:MAG TPA: MAPEG family protein [Pelomicrobium sp.]|nr:MAPEG family protein [Pelomicrobium sp.]